MGDVAMKGRLRKNSVRLDGDYRAMIGYILALAAQVSATQADLDKPQQH